MLSIGYAKSVPDEGLQIIDSPEPLTRLEFAALIQATLSHKGRGEVRALRLHPLAILRQCSNAAPIRFSLASGVRNAEWADSVTLGNFVSG